MPPEKSGDQSRPAGCELIDGDLKGEAHHDDRCGAQAMVKVTAILVRRSVSEPSSGSIRTSGLPYVTAP